MQQDRTCIAGQTCKFNGFEGYGMSYQDSLVILETCGNDFTGSPQFPQLGIAQTEAFVYWGSDAIISGGGEYRLC